MSRSNISESLVSDAEFPLGVRSLVEGVVLRNPALRLSLAANPHLGEEAWWQLYKPSLKKAAAAGLVARPLTRDQRVRVLEVEKRSTLLEDLVENNVLDADEQALVLSSPGFSPGVAAKVLEAEWCEPALRRAFGTAAGGQVQLDWLASSSGEECSDEEASSLLADFSSWGPQLDENGPRGKRARSRALTALLHRRPALLPVAVAPGQHPAVVMAAVGCRHLVDESLQIAALGFVPGGDLPSDEEVAERQYMYMALVNNPPTSPRVVSEVIRLSGRPNSYKLVDSARSRLVKHPTALTTPYEEVVAGEDLRWIASRALPSEYRPEGRPFDVLALARNPHLGEGLAVKVASALDVVGELSDEEVRSGRAALGANHPDVVPGWWRQDAEERSSDRFHQRYHAEPFTLGDLGSVSVRSLVYEDVVVRSVPVISETLGQSAGAWESFFTLVDEFDGNVADLVNLCRML